MLLHPRFPDTVHITVVKEEDRIVGRRGHKHVTADPCVHPIVQAWRSRERNPAFEPIAKATGDRCAPRRRIIHGLPERVRDARAGREAACTLRERAAQAAVGGPQVAAFRRLSRY